MDPEKFNNGYYLSTLSADAAPVLLDENLNPYYRSDDADMPYWMDDYCYRIDTKTRHMGIRNFNFSLNYAKNKGKF